jgi:hypothetical protein
MRIAMNRVRVGVGPTMLAAVCWLVFALLLFVAPPGKAQDKASKPDLKKLPTERLLSCFDDWKVCEESDWNIADELLKRGIVHDLLGIYWRDSRFMVRNGIEKVAYQVDSAEVVDFMRRIVVEKVDDGEDDYFPVNYMAKKCYPQALAELSTGKYRNQGSMQYESSVELFGRCKYRPAIPYLVGTALHDFSFNIIEAADHSLHKLYPDSPKDFDDLATMQRYYCDRAHKERFKVKCEYDY